MYWVYILSCADGSFYTGITTDIDRRIDQHNGLVKGGAKYTASRAPVVLRYSCMFPDRSLASKEEYRIKKLNRQEKEALIKTHQS